MVELYDQCKFHYTATSIQIPRILKTLMIMSMKYALLAVLLLFANNSDSFLHNKIVRYKASYLKGEETYQCRKSALFFGRRPTKPAPTPSKPSTSTLSGDRLVLDDFDQIVEALIYFKNTYGDLLIPENFEVPTSDNWPSSIHGLRLGKRLTKILSQPSFFIEHRDKVDALIKVGFRPHLDSIINDFAVLCKALQAYKTYYGDLNVKPNFIIPNEQPWPLFLRNYKLGSKVTGLLNNPKSVLDQPEKKAILDELGFPWLSEQPSISEEQPREKVESDESSFNKLLSCLNFYQENIDDEMNIPDNYIIPENNVWPTEYHGYKLGAVLKGIREDEEFASTYPDQYQQILDTGYSFYTTAKARLAKQQFEIIYKALKTYKSIYGNLNIPLEFVIPRLLEWPEDLWDLKLGLRAHSIKSHGAFVSNNVGRWRMIDKLGFPWTVDDSAESEEMNEDERDDEDDFFFDDDDSELKRDLQLLNEHGEYYFPEEEHEEDDFDDFDEDEDYSSDNRFDETYDEDPFANYDQTFRNFKINKINYPAPCREEAAGAYLDMMDDYQFNKDSRIRKIGAHLGNLEVHELGFKLYPQPSEEDIAYMRNNSYRLLEFAGYSWNTVLEGLRAYKNAYGSLDISTDYEFTEDIVRRLNVSESLIGLNLYSAAREIRAGDADGFEDPVRRPILDRLGFIWDDQRKYLRFRFNAFYIALRLYDRFYDVLCPEPEFVVPDDDRWPHWMVGMPLGEWSENCRYQQQLLRVLYPDRYMLLQDLGFIWYMPVDKATVERFKDWPQFTFKQPFQDFVIFDAMDDTY